MSAYVNDRDVLITGANSRLFAGSDSTIVLDASALAFYKRADGTHLPDKITVSASLVLCDGPITFQATGATLSNVTDTACDILFSSVTGSSVTLQASAANGGSQINRSMLLSVVSDGVQGTAGADGAAGTPGNQYALAHLFKWAPSAPAVPTGASTLSWVDGSNTSYTGTDGWTTTIPSNPGTPNLQLYVATVPVSAASGTATSNVAYSSALVQAWAQNGANGANGTNGTNGGQSYPATVYQWAATLPAGPSGSATLTWSTRNFGSAPSGWALTPGNSPSPGYTLWAASVLVTDSSANATTNFNWTSASITAAGYAGSNGSNGSTGAEGASYVTAYCASATASTTTTPASTTGKTSVPAVNDGGISGTWQSTVPTLASGQFLYQSDGIYDPTTNKVNWSIPYWSSLKVGTLSAITANLGAITAGSINIGNGVAVINSDGSALFTNITIGSTGGSTLFHPDGSGSVQTSINNAATTSTWSGISGSGKPQDYRIVTAGGSNTTATDPIGFYHGGSLVNNIGAAGGRSYTLTKIRRSDGVPISSQVYDVFGVGTSGSSVLTAADLANDLNACGSDVIVVVWSYDEPQGHRLDSGLDTAMYRCGASRAVFGSSNFRYRSAYVLIGIPGVGEGNGAEAYQGSVDSDTNAWVDVGFSITNSALSGVTANYTPKTLTDYGYTGDLNATNGATLGVNVNGTASSLSTLSSTIGTYTKTGSSGGKTIISDAAIKIYDGAGALRVQIGDLSA